MARRLIALAGVAGLLGVGCAEPAPPTLADGSVVAALPAALWPDDPSIVADVACPDLDPELIAQSTTCTAVLDADAVTVDVVIDEAGAATASVREPLFVPADAAEQLTTRLETDLSIDAVDTVCRAVVIVAEPGRSVVCDATHDGRPIEFEIVLDRAGDGWTLRVAG